MYQGANIDVNPLLSSVVALKRLTKFVLPVLVYNAAWHILGCSSFVPLEFATAKSHRRLTNTYSVRAQYIFRSITSELSAVMLYTMVHIITVG